MDDPQPPNTLAAAFPAPPPFWQSFTPENLERISKLRAPQNRTRREENGIPPRILNLPPELRFLQPPEPPVEGVYRCFGDVFNLKDPLPTLQEMSIQQLYTPPPSPSSHIDRALILKRLAKSLLLNFLELTGIMSTNPEQYEEKVQDLRTLFINFHHLLNEYRPHQARESLILMMQDQLEKSRKETQGIRAVKERVEGVIEGLGKLKLAEFENGKVGQGEVEVVEDGRDVWETLEKEFS
ncbi:Mediator of RNA polymerase II transcription subunit [Lachnellula hyalina]|uniref:Mediator of RNA polymerase II transcription subunit 7 n=1 Tax=Lachnellula hyalina TaxID=1316788 RepID=A0A8H8QZZ2_9HELO|nr:Mediator of RNA polymerase II transcription subunit [Lachnellula hyalina]TVY25161.1 Mediator of RNA polymerase II transcription subunit [Lachnellula hyalina]